MKKLSIILLSLIALATANATPQARDVLYWNDTKYYIFPYIDIESRLSTIELERLNELKTANPPTGNYRGYSYEFIINRDTLFLISVYDAYKKDITESLFGGQIKMPLNFFTDTLYLGYGEPYYDHAWWTMVYESEITVFFQNGVVRWTKDNHNKSKQSPYTYNIQLFQEYIYSNIRWNELDFQTLQKKPIVHLGYETDSIDKIDNVKILRSSGYAQFDEEAVRVLKSIPSISVSFVKGKYLRHSYTYRIVFDIEKARRFRRVVETSLFDSIQTNNHYEKAYNFTQLPLLSIENGNLIPLIDSVVRFYDSFEQKSDSLFITISTLKRPEQEYPILLISSNEHRITIFDGLEDPIGFFYHKNYLFVVYNKESEQFFSTTNTKKSFCYDPHIKDKLFVIDDSQPYWYYKFFGDKFVLLSECIPPEYRLQRNDE